MSEVGKALSAIADVEKHVGPKVPVTMRALVQRISRRLQRDAGHADVSLRASRGLRQKQNFGDFYVVERNTVTHWHIDPKEWGRELGVLEAYETVQ